MATLEKLCTLSNNENDSSDASTENTNKFNKTRKSKQTNKKCAHQNLKNISTQTKNARKLNELTGNNEATAIDVNDFSRNEIGRSNTTQLYDDLSIKIKKCVTMSTSDDQCNSLNSQYAANMKYQQLNNQYDINNTPEHCHRMNENLECNNDFIKQNSDSDERYKLFVTGSIIFLFCYNLVISYYLLGVLNIPKSISNSRSDLENIFNTVEFKMAIERLTKEPVQFDLNRRKRGALTLDDNAVGGGSMSNGPTRRKALQVEGPSKDYFGLRDEAVEKEAEWFWLSGTSRVPKKDIVTFCHESRDFCLPSMKGSPGPSGERGDRGPRGERGETGLPGQIGPPGPTGPRGPPGEVGWPGAPGLDGRDGVPGEPGLDGVPGRSGTDGLPGLDGIPGKDGLSGKDGKDGINGLNGKTGPQGPPGPMGSRGLTGPRGRLGKAGTNGTPGVPGITAWIHGGINGSKDLLIPPSIAGSAAVKPIVVHEGENLRMRCAATGQPRPLVEWRKVDGSIIPLGSWQAVSVQGHTLNLTRINRAHMGEYMCVADNGVPPAANQTFNVEVHFPPMIRIRKQMVGAANGTTATLECEVEAFPEAVRYWERADGRLLESSGYGDGGKYRVDLPDSPPGTPTYRSQMRLNVTRISPHDYTLYHCIAKNEMGVTRGVFTLYEIDPRLAKTYKTGTDSPEGGVAVYGERPPERVTLEDLCPPSPQCRECPVGPGGIALGPGPATCRSDTAVSLYDLVGGRLDVRTLVPEGHLAGAPLHSASYTGLPNRTLDCVLYAVGKPVYHRFTDLTYGSWMRDAAPKNDAAGERLWVTREDETRFLYEFANKTAFRKDMYTKRYTLVHPFKGNAHVIYNGSFFYNSRDKPARVLRFNLDTEYVSLDLPVAGTNVTTAVPLYTNEYNLMDFSVDDNGLWVIYGLPGSNNTAVAKIDTNAMKVQHAWNASVNHKRVGDMFVACGVLYAVDSTIERNTRVRLALDLYKSLLLEVNLAFTNPFRRTTMLGYNPRNKELYSWDKGNQLTYPVRYHEIGYNQTFEDRQQEPYAQMQTGHEVYT